MQHTCPCRIGHPPQYHSAQAAQQSTQPDSRLPDDSPKRGNRPIRHPTLCIVVPLYNKAGFIADTIASLANQSPPPDELVIVDDGSTDDSLRVCRQALAQHAGALAQSHITVLELTANGGPGHARNCGIAVSSADWIGFLDADDGYFPDTLSRVRTAWARHDLDLIVLGYQSDPPGEHFPQLENLEGRIQPIDHGLSLLREPLHTVSGADFFMGRASNVMVRRAWLAELRYDEHARLNEGIDFWYRVLKQVLVLKPEAGIALFTDPLIRFRIVPDSLSHRVVADWQALPPPPSVLRYRLSGAPEDQRLVRTLAFRWVEHAHWILPDDVQVSAFWAAHAELLASLGIVRSTEGAPC